MVHHFGNILFSELQQFMDAGCERGRVSGDSEGFSSPSSSSEDVSASACREDDPGIFEKDEFTPNASLRSKLT
jgi:hypothetical protein